MSGYSRNDRALSEIRNLEIIPGFQPNNQSSCLVKLGDTERRELEEVTLSLEKLQRGDYGRCEVCSEFIPKPRLEALPTARLCVSCQEADEQNRIPSYNRQRSRRFYGEDDTEFSHPLMSKDDDD